MSKKANFTENDSVEGAYKASLFKALFKERKGLLDKGGYPVPSKGLKFPEPCLKFGASNYTFKTTEICDKIVCVDGKREFLARYKKDTKKFDVSMKCPAANNCNVLVKYEQTDGGNFVVGADYAVACCAMNAKVNPGSGLLKASAMYDASAILKGLKAAMDCKVAFKNPGNNPMWNLGGSYSSPLGLTVIGAGSNGLLTLNHYMDLSKYVNQPVSGALEVVQPYQKTAANKNSPCVVALGYQLDGSHKITTRVNAAGECSVGLKKDFTKNLSVQACTICNLKDPASCLSSPPAFGFKIIAK